MKKIFKKIYPLIIAATIGLSLVASSAFAVITSVPVGGTGVNSITGIPYGTGTSPLSIVTIGSGLSFIGGTLSASATSGVTSFNTRTGAVTLSSGDVTGALGFTPYNATNPSNYIALTALSATSPIFYNNSTGVISSQAATTSLNGYLTSTDWNTFNNKQGTITLTTTGTSGLATFSSGTLNIPNYTYTLPTATTSVLGGVKVDGTSITISSGVISAATSGGGTVTSVTSATGDATVANTTTTPIITIVSAPKFTTARTIAGTSFDGTSNVTLANKFIVQGTTDAGLTGAQFLGALSTGIVKNTTTTGVLSIATAGTDYQAPITLTTTGTSGAATFISNTLNIPQYAGTTYTAGTGLTLTTGTFSVNTSQNIATLSNLTSNGFVTTSGGAGTLSVTGSTGSGNVVLATSPTLVTPVLGVATGTSFNGVALTTGGSATTFLNGAGSYTAPFTLTTTGTSGAATFSAGTLNIPQYTGSTGTVTSVATDSTLTGGPITTTGTLGINLANANTWTAKQTISTAPFAISGNQTLAAWGLVGPQISVAAATLTDSSTAAGATVTNAMANSIGIPTITAANATSGSKVTYTNAASLYIAGIPALGTNTLATNMYALDVASGLVNMGGQLNVSSTINSSSFMTATSGYFINGTNQGIESTNSSTNVSIRSGGVQNRLVIASTGFVGIGSFTVPGVLTTSVSPTAAAWGLNGINFQTTAQTFTDSSTASGTVTNNMVNTFGIPTLAATNASITYTNAATVYIAGAPVNGTNATITNKYALDIAGGLSFFGGHMNIEGVTSTGATGTGNFVFATSPTFSGATITTSTVNGVTLSTGSGSTTFLNGAGSYTTPTSGTKIIAEDFTQHVLSTANFNYTLSVPGGTLSTNSGIHFQIIFSNVNVTSSDTCQIAWTYGGVSLGSSTIGAGPSSYNGANAQVDGYMYANASASAQKTSIKAVWGATSSGTFAQNGSYTNTTVSSGSNQNLVATFTRGVNGDCTAEGLIITSL